MDMSKKLKRIFRRMSVLGVMLAVFWWMSEAFVMTFIFRNGGLIEQLFYPGPHEAWMRSVTFLIIIAFGLYGQALINRRTKAQESLQRSWEYFQSLAEYSSDLTVVLDEHMTRQYVSRSVEGTLGYRPEEMVGQKPFGYVHPDDEPLGIELMTQLIRNKDHVARAEMRIMHKDGSWRVFEVAGRNLLDNPAVRGLVANCHDITERKKAEDELRELEEMYRALIENSPNGIFISDADRFIFVNQRLCEITGFSEEELLSMTDPVGILIAPSDQEQAFASALNRLEGRPTPTDLEIQSIRKDGEVISLKLTVATIVLSGMPVLQGVIEDITERKKAEEALRESEAQFRAIFEDSAMGVGIVDRNGRPVKINQALHKMLGYTAEELASLAFTDLIHPDNAAIDMPLFMEMKEGIRDHYQVEKQYIRKDGQTIWGRLTLSAVRDADGELRLAIGMIDDTTKQKLTQEELAEYRRHLEKLVTERTAELTNTNEQLKNEIEERIQADKALRESEDKFRTIYAESPIGIELYDSRGLLIDVNKACLEIFGICGTENVKGFKLFEDPNVTDGIKEKLRRGETARYEVNFDFEKVKLNNLYITSKSGNSYLDVLVTPLGTNDKNPEYGYLVQVQDITERKQAEDKIQQLYEHEKDLRLQLEREMNRRMEFTRALAHELKTPLTPMLISSQILASELEEGPLQRLADSVSRGTINLNSRIDELLDLAKGEVGMLQLKAEPVDVIQLLREVVDDTMQLASSRNQSLIPELTPSLPQVSADATRLRQIVMNLLNNAFRFTPEGGKVVLRASANNNNLSVEIQDTGPGIPEEKQKWLFEPYQRLENEGGERCGGLGLGLALCKTLVELHGGQVWLKSQAGRGSTFGFSLPLIINCLSEGDADKQVNYESATY